MISLMTCIRMYRTVACRIANRALAKVSDPGFVTVHPMVGLVDNIQKSEMPPSLYPAAALPGLGSGGGESASRCFSLPRAATEFLVRWLVSQGTRYVYVYLV